MKRIIILIFAIVFFLSACGAENGIEVHEAWMRPAAQGDNGAIYFVIHNHASQADALTGITSEVAGAIEMHESKMSGDVMQMQQLDSIPLEAFAELNFEPGGLHIMLVDLKKDLKIGDKIEITLHFTNFEDISITVPVRDTPAPAEDHSSTEH
ncbi:MAG TPA: copper chaperone PCu(A)C [Candidatus Saccharimonadales bacterium]|nr:copper chaperone PCu(A)C [Candidatus Saccharimonadales bacterium]